MRRNETAWFGEIPQGWEILKAKYIFQEQKRVSNTGQEDLLSVSEYNGVTLKKNSLKEGDFITRAKTLIGYQIVQKHNLVMNIMLAWKSGLGFAFQDGIVSPAYAVFKLLRGHSKYFHYLLRTSFYASKFGMLSYGIIPSRWRLYPEIFLSIPTLIPPLETQKRIANFLDTETARIDTLVAKKEKQIQLLLEKRKVLITRVVSKGLDPHVPMKPSGIAWLGDIPEGWELVQAKYCYDIRLGKMLSNQQNTNEEKYIPYLKAINVHWNKVNSDIENKMWVSWKDIKDFGVRKGDLLVCEGGEVGRAGIIEEVPKHCIIQNALHRVRETNISSNKFLYYFMHHVSTTNWFNVLCNKATIAHFTYEKFQSFKIPLPPLAEQRRIADFLDKETRTIDAAQDTIRTSITLLKEYRASLINHAVFGKLKHLR